jgi:hypothetical protein
MDTLRWIIVCVVAVPAAVVTFLNFCLAVRRIVYFTNSGPSWLPLIGSLAAVVGLIAVPKTDSVFKLPVILAFCLFLIFDGSYGIADIINNLRARFTGRRPS